MKKTRAIRRKIKIWAVGVALLLQACAPATDTATQTDLAAKRSGFHVAERTIPKRAKYVALGSSFAAGAGIGPSQPGAPVRCSRAVNNYPSLLAMRLDLMLDDQSCGGATTASILEPWGELPAQADALDTDTRLVTVTIGGNDLNYVGNLFMASCMAGRALEFEGREVPCHEPLAPDDESYSKLERALGGLADQVNARAPNALLVFVQYVTLVPEETCEAVDMSDDHADLNRQIGLRLAEITTRVASETNSLLLAADEVSREHTPCDASPWATGFPPDYDPSNGAPWHPNSAGHEAIADALAGMLNGTVKANWLSGQGGASPPR